MAFRDFCKFWSLTSVLDCAEEATCGEIGTERGAFGAATRVFESWAVHLAPLRTMVDLLHIASAAEQLTGTLSAIITEGDGFGLAHIDKLEQATAAAESTAQRFHQAHEVLAEAVSQTLEAGRDTLPDGLVQVRDAAFEELKEALQHLEEYSSGLDLVALHAAASARLAPVELALKNLERATGISLAPALEADIGSNDSNDDIDAVEECSAALLLTAGGVSHHLQRSAASARQLAKHFLTRAEDHMLEAAMDLQSEICAVVALETGSDEGPLAVLKDATPWDAILRCATRLLAPLRSIDCTVEHLKVRAAALRSEVDAFASGFARRVQEVSTFEALHKAMKNARKSYIQLKAAHDANSDDDSDAEEVNPEELSRQRHACRVETSNRDKAARRLFLDAKAYHPETLVEKRKRLRLTGLSAIWSERTLDDYDERQPLLRKSEARHAVFRAKYENDICILKLVQLHDGHTLCKEAELLRQLHHPNIVRLEAAFVEPGLLYLHLSYAKHGDLEQFLELQARTASAGHISANQLCRMSRQLCDALMYLAERNIVHCDVKPANVFVDEEKDGSAAPIAILGDFDVSHTASGRTSTLTMALQTRGIATHYSAGYAAPEVVRAPPGQPPRATSKLDVFGLGCVIYHMHLYPRALPEPEHLNDDVASCVDLFEQDGTGALPQCAVAAWARAAPRHAIAGATRADPTARLSPRELLQTEYMRRADGEYARVTVERPAYWQNQEHTGSWRVRESPEVVAQVENLLNDTAMPKENGIGRDSHGERFTRFRVTSVHRVENSHIWSAYASRRQAVADALASEDYILPEPAQRLSTSSFFYPLEGGTLEAAAGEVFLFHGTSKPESIASSGFDVRYAYAGAGAGATFGRGVYFAESASKSDQYVWPSAAGKLTLIISRVCLGRCQAIDHSRRNASFLPEVEGKSTAAVPVHYDSILTEVPAMRFREIVVGRDASAYPELLVEYERV
jgi:serine/threonine protein kinase